MNNEEFGSLAAAANASSIQTGQMPTRPAIHLTPRESQIVRYVMLGESNKQIARRLGISNYTVRDHVSNLLKKTGVTSRSRLALVLSASSAQPPVVASRLDAIQQASITHRPSGQPLPGAGPDGEQAGLPWIR